MVIWATSRCLLISWDSIGPTMMCIVCVDRYFIGAYVIKGC